MQCKNKIKFTIVLFITIYLYKIARNVQLYNTKIKDVLLLSTIVLIVLEYLILYSTFIFVLLYNWTIA